MERNYDEIIADMLRQIDRHTARFEKHSRELSKHSKELKRQSMRSEEFFKGLKDWMLGREAIQDNHLELIIHTANLLDRVVKRDRLKT